MASCIIGGMVANDFDPRQILVGTPSQSTRDRLSAATGATTMADNHQAAARADIVVLAVKPKMMRQVVMDLASALTHRPIIISVAAGIPVAALKQWLGSDMPVIRAMPNTPSMIQAGATGLFTQSDLTNEQRSLVDQIFQAIGYSCWVDSEELIDAVIAVSGSGPAYFFLMMESLINAGVAEGLSTEISTQLVLQTALGAAVMAKQSESDAGTLRKQVTSPGGTTQAAIEHFQSVKFEKAVGDAVNAARTRSVELSKN